MQSFKYKMQKHSRKYKLQKVRGYKKGATRKEQQE